MSSALSRLAQATSNHRLFRSFMSWQQRTRRHKAVAPLGNLNAFERQVYSQNGEDGIISEIFARIPNNRFFVEIGVEVGLECNSALLARHYNWRGVMIEGDAKNFEQLTENYANYAVMCIHRFVDRENVNSLLEEAQVPHNFDLLSIDIDGNDYYVWEATAKYKPSVVVIEYNATLGPEVSRTISYDRFHVWHKDRYYGASISALANLGKKLGYALIGTDSRAVNAFFIRRDHLSLCGFPEKGVREAWHAPGVFRRILPSGSGRFVDV